MTSRTAPRDRIPNLMAGKSTDCHYCLRPTITFADPNRRHPRRRTIEHIVPVSRGFPESHSVWNTVWACQECNETHVGFPDHCDTCRDAWRNARYLAAGLRIVPDAAPEESPLRGLAPYRFGYGWEIRACEWCGNGFVATWPGNRREQRTWACCAEHARLAQRQRQLDRKRDEALAEDRERGQGARVS